MGASYSRTFLRFSLVADGQSEEADQDLFPGNGDGDPFLVHFVLGDESRNQADPLGLLDLPLPFRPEGIDPVIHQADLAEGFPEQSED